MKPFVFFSQDLAYTGSEIALYSALSHSERFRGVPVVLRRTGALARQLASRFPVITEPSPDAGSWWQRQRRRASSRVRRSLGLPPIGFLDSIARRYPHSVWYVNTIVLPHIVEYAEAHAIECVVHSHEAAPMFDCLSQEQTRRLIQYPRLLITCSGVAADALRTLGRSKDIEVCHPPVDFARFSGVAATREGTRESLGFAKDSFVWASSGTINPNKNPALFVDIAHHLVKSHPRSRFLWLGDKDTGYSSYVRQRAGELGISEKVVWAGAQEGNYPNCLNACDGFMLLSTSESLSLVILEAMYLGKPVVALANDGVREVLSSDEAGLIVESRRAQDAVRSMVDVMDGRWLHSPSEARNIALRFDVSAQVGRWENVLSSYFGGA